ncbi:MAG: Uncharacterised protein [Bacteroidetes bacterium MED-G17]|nr:MAG: Uncharacterised protein [Bacteroidetes bacterium MED-G17]
MKTLYINFFIVLFAFTASAQEVESLIENYELYSDSSLETQYSFVQELLYVAGYVPEKITVYQTLPNNARVYRVTLDSVNGGFLFIRWNKKEKKHYVANKMIDVGMYYNLKAAEEIMRKQTENASFSADDISIQAGDQFQISGEDINELRNQYDKKTEAQKKVQSNLHKYQLEKARRKGERKRSKN